jgi:hypothetical protein
VRKAPGRFPAQGGLPLSTSPHGQKVPNLCRALVRRAALCSRADSCMAFVSEPATRTVARVHLGCHDSGETCSVALPSGVSPQSWVR